MMRYNRWTAMLLAVAMTMSLFTASTWAAETKADDLPEAVYKGVYSQKPSVSPGIKLFRCTA